MKWTKGDTYPDQTMCGDDALYEVTATYSAEPEPDGRTPGFDWTYFVVKTGPHPGYEGDTFGVCEQLHGYKATADDYEDETYEYEWADVRIFETFEEAKARATELAAEDQADLLTWTTTDPTPTPESEPHHA